MPVQIGQKESGFDNPLGLLSDCHRRIEHFLEVLIKIVKKGESGPLAPEELTALENALEYFRNAAPKHTADEEHSLFPRLRATHDAQAALECMSALESDHEAAMHDHEVVDGIGWRWIERAAKVDEESREMRQALERLAERYARHIAIEDNELFPLAARVLPRHQLTEVGREMAERRGVAEPDPELC